MRLKRLLTRHWALTFVIMGIAALILGLASTSLFFFFKANLALVAEHGMRALAEGGLEELLKLMMYGFLTLGAYIVFKACEKLLVDKTLK